MTVFVPLADVSQRQMVIDMAADVEPGEIITYEAIESLLGLDRPRAQSVVNQAKFGLQKTHQKSLVAVRGVGYRVLSPSEHLELAKVHQAKGRRQTRKSRQAVEHTDYSKLNEAERTKYDVAIGVLRTLERWERRADLRYASRERLDDFVSAQSTKNARTDSEVSDLKTRLARIEQLLDKGTSSSQATNTASGADQ